MPQAVSAGLKRMAMVIAEVSLSKVIIEEAVKQVQIPGLEMRNFDSVTAATIWARSGVIEL